jgi:valyl-tRNA synthetase
MAGDVEVILLLEAPADSAAERAKLEKERSKLSADREYLSKKLANPQYQEKAKPAALEKDRARLAEVEAALARLETALSRLN